MATVQERILPEILFRLMLANPAFPQNFTLSSLEEKGRAINVDMGPSACSQVTGLQLFTVGFSVLRSAPEGGIHVESFGPGLSGLFNQLSL